MIICFYIYFLVAKSKEVFSIDPSEPDDFLKSILSNRELEIVRNQFKAPSIESNTNSEFPQWTKESEIFEKTEHNEILIDLPRSAIELNPQMLSITEKSEELQDILELKRLYDEILEENYALKNQLRALAESISTSVSIHASDNDIQVSDCSEHLQSFKEDLMSCNIALKESLLQNNVIDTDMNIDESETNSDTSNMSPRTCVRSTVEDQMDDKCAFDQGIDTIQPEIVNDNRKIEFENDEKISSDQQGLYEALSINDDGKKIINDDEKTAEGISSSEHNKYFEYIYSILVLIKRISKFTLETGHSILFNVQNMMINVQKLMYSFVVPIYVHHIQRLLLYLYGSYMKPLAINVAQYINFMFSKLLDNYVSPIWNYFIILPYEIHLKPYTTFIGSGIQSFYVATLESFVDTYIEPSIFYLWNKINRVVYNVFRICDRDDIWERLTYSITIIFSATFDSLESIIVWGRTSSLARRIFGKYTDEMVMIIIYTISAILLVLLRKLVLGILATFLFVLLSPILFIVFMYSKIRQLFYGKFKKNQKIKPKKTLSGKKKLSSNSEVTHAINSNNDLQKESTRKSEEIAKVTSKRNEDKFASKFSNTQHSNVPSISNSTYGNTYYNGNDSYENNKNRDSYQQKDAYYEDNA